MQKCSRKNFMGSRVCSFVAEILQRVRDSNMKTEM